MTNSTKPTIRIHNLATDEVIDREMTDAEFADYEANQAAQAAKQAEAQAKATARAAILDRLGLTGEEAALLLS
jgi:acyl-CoA reductase-like NAD-dependent aldehyde dehydrogenase